MQGIHKLKYKQSSIHVTGEGNITTWILIWLPNQYNHVLEINSHSCAVKQNNEHKKFHFKRKTTCNNVAEVTLWGSIMIKTKSQLS